MTSNVPSTETTELGSVEPGRLTWPCRPITPPSVKLVPLNMVAEADPVQHQRRAEALADDQQRRRLDVGLEPADAERRRVDLEGGVQVAEAALEERAAAALVDVGGADPAVQVAVVGHVDLPR